MARIRSIKPGFFKNEQLASLSFEWRLLFIGLWTQADRAGRLEDRPQRLKAELFPYDPVDIDAGLLSLVRLGLITRYQVGHQRLIAVPTWNKHQQPHVKETPSEFPSPSSLGCQLVDVFATSESTGLIPCLPRASTPDPDPDPDPDQGADPDPDQGADPGTETPSPTRAHNARESRRASLMGRFDQFWTAYPRKEGRGAAVRIWERLKPNDALLATMLAAIEQQKRGRQWQRESGQFIPHPKTWLHQQRWLDRGIEPSATAPHVSDRTRANLANAEVAKAFIRSRT